MPLIEAYTRKSRALGDPDDPALLATHVELIRRMAAADGVTLPEEAIYTEIGSGETIAARPTFSRLLAAWEALPAGTGGRLYTPALDRVTRGELLEVARVEAALARAGIRLRTEGREYDLNRSEDRLFFRFVCVIASHELAQYRERTARTRAQQLRDGKSRNGRPCFGYRRNRKDREFEPDPDRFPILKALLADAFDLSLSQLAHKYGLPRHVVQITVSCPIVCGYPAQVYQCHGRTKRRQQDGEVWVKQYVRVPLEQWRWPEHAGNYEAAITKDEFLRLQAARATRRLGQNGAYAPHGWCRDVVWFAGQPEGVPVRLGTWSNGRGRGWSTYEVPTPAPPLLYIRREAVHEAVTAAIAAAWSEPALVTASLARYQEEEEAKRAAWTRSGGPEPRSRAERRLTALLRQYDDLVLAEVTANGEKAAALARLLLTTEKAITETRARLLHLPAAPDPALPLLRLLGQVPALLSERFADVWETFADTERRRVTRLTLARVRVEVTPGIHHRAYRREVGEITRQPWMPGASSAVR